MIIPVRYGIEYFFAGGEGETGSGVHTQAPRTSPHGSPWVYLKTVEIGTTTLSQREVNEVADRLGRENFLASTYHLLAKNCNHFSDAFCKAITKNKAGIPGWANRAANWGNAFFGPPASVTRPPQTEPREPPKKSVFETTKGYRLADGAPAATSSSARQKGSQQQRKNPWRDPNFFPGKKSDAAGAGAGVGGVPSS